MASKSRLSSFVAYAQSSIDRVVSPETRSRFYSNINTFAHDQPLLFAFLALQAGLSSIPLLLFSTFLLSTILFALLTSIVFILFWLSIALLVLVPTLFITTGLGVIVWIWGVSTWVVGRWVYGLLPGAHGKGELVVVNKGKWGENGVFNGKKIVVEKRDDKSVLNGGLKGEVQNGV